MDQSDADRHEQQEVATLAGGCFWCLEAVFEELKGVEKVESGYAGGASPSPTYEEVSGGRSGHAETVRITFDPSVISFRELLRVFFGFHDPTTPNRQGPDVGTQYRSAVFYNSPEQKQIAETVIAELEKERIWENPIVTEVAPLTTFFPGEEYHQHFYQRNPDQPYCRAIIAPKLAKLRREYLKNLKS